MALVRFGRGEKAWELREVGGANGGGCRGGAGLGWRLRGGVKLVGVHSGAAACSGVWTRGESKGASEIEAWDSCSAQARERARAGPLVWALHGGGEVAAGGAVLEAAGRVAREEEGQREATGGGGGRPRRVGASARRSNGRNGREGAGGGAVSGVGGENRAGRWEMVIRAILQLLKIPGTKL